MSLKNNIGVKIEKKGEHWKTWSNNPYFASVDFQEPAILTVKRIYREKDQTRRSQEMFLVMSFEELKLPNGITVKPMVMNVGHQMQMTAFAGDPHIGMWKGYRIMLYCQDGVRSPSGGTTSGIRIHKTLPALPVAINSKQVAEMEKIISDKKIDKTAFLKWVGFSSIAEITTSEYSRVLSALKRKK